MARRRFRKRTTTGKLYIVDYGSKAGPIRAYKPTPAGRMPRGGRRGPITGYSPEARRRFVREIHRLAVRWEGRPPLFVTLTLPGRDWKRIDYKAAFKRWRERLCDAVPGVWGFWVLEYQDRGAVHYHLALDREAIEGACRGWRTFRRWVARSWYASVGSGQATHLRAGTNVEPFEKLPVYLAKEMGKHLSPRARARGAPHHTGRFWGKIGAELIKDHQIERATAVSEGEFRVFRKARRRYWSPMLRRLAAREGWENLNFRVPGFLPNGAYLKTFKKARRRARRARRAAREKRLRMVVRNGPAESQAAGALRKRPTRRGNT